MPAQSQDITAESTIVPSGFISFLEPATVLRSRGSLVLSFLAAGLTTDDEARVGVGLGVFGTDTITLGSAAGLTDPLGDVDFPWLFWNEINMYNIAASGNQPGAQVRVEVDSKSMRKVKPNETLAWIAQYGDVNGLPGVRLAFTQTRVLVGT